MILILFVIFLLLVIIGVTLYFMGYIPGTKKYILRKGGYENLKKLINKYKNVLRNDLTEEEKREINDEIKSKCNTFDGEYLKDNFDKIEKELKKLDKKTVDAIGEICGLI